MKKFSPLIILMCMSLQSCIFMLWDEPSEEIPEPISDYEALRYTRVDLDQTIQLLPPKNINRSGKIYVFNDFLFIAEPRKGFHVFDNSNPEEPVKIKFLQALGATDLAIRSNILYINQATDLISLEFDLANDSLKLTKRIPNTFPDLISPDGYFTPQHLDSVTVDWILKADL